MTPPNWQKIQTLPVADIQVEERLRTASATAVASIVSSIQEVGGILQPLLVRRIKDGYRLMDGLHRLTAAREAGLDEVPVKVTECTNDEAIRIEVDANVAGAPLTPLDMAVFLAEHKKLYELDNPDSTRGKAGARGRWNATDKMSVASFAANAAEVFGKGERQIFRLISVGEKLSKEEIGQLRCAPNRVQFKDLEHIAKCGAQSDRSEICAALGAGEAKSAKEVLDRKKAPGAATVSSAEAQSGKIGDAFSRASKAARLQFVRTHFDDLAALLAEAFSPVSALTGRLEREMAPAMEEAIKQIEGMLEASSNLEEFREHLLSAFPNMNTGQLAETMAQAITASVTAGMASVEDEAGA